MTNWAGALLCWKCHLRENTPENESMHVYCLRSILPLKMQSKTSHTHLRMILCILQAQRCVTMYQKEHLIPNKLLRSALQKLHALCNCIMSVKWLFNLNNEWRGIYTYTHWFCAHGPWIHQTRREYKTASSPAYIFTHEIKPFIAGCWLLVLEWSGMDSINFLYFLSCDDNTVWVFVMHKVQVSIGLSTPTHRQVVAPILIQFKWK